MVKVQDDILHAIDSNRAVVPRKLDLSAAFYTVSHEILLNRLSQRYGITAISTQSSFSHVEESAHSQTREYWRREWVLQDLYKNGLLPTYHLVHNLFKLNVQDLLYVNLVAIYRRGLFLGLCNMFCTPQRWLIS